MGMAIDTFKVVIGDMHYIWKPSTSCNCSNPSQ